MIIILETLFCVLYILLHYYVRHFSECRREFSNILALILKSSYVKTCTSRITFPSENLITLHISPRFDKLLALTNESLSLAPLSIEGSRISLYFGAILPKNKYPMLLSYSL